MDTLTVGVPFHKPDISLPADIVEEILRIDGLDSIEIPTNINISPSIEENYLGERLKEKISNVLTGLGFTEILTNSITNAAYFSEEELATVVRLLNNLSSELNVMRPSMLHTALEVVSFNNNRKNLNLKFFEFGQTYSTTDTGKYKETPHLCLYITGEITEANWKQKSTTSDIYYLKGITETVLAALGVKNISFSTSTTKDLQAAVEAEEQGEKLVVLGQVSNELASKFDIKQPVYFADFYWDTILKYASKKIQFKEIPKYPSVERDLAIVVPKSMTYHEIQQQVNKLKLKTLQDLRLFDVFESEKLGADKKSMAINFRFIDEEKTLTDKEIDTWMNRIMITLEKELNAEIRK